MKTYFQSAVILAVLLSLVSCFKPSGEYEADINFDDLSPAQITLSPDDSLIYICEETEIKYEMLLDDGKKFLFVDVFINEELFKSQQMNPWHVTIDPEEFEPGEYLIDFVFYSTTGSGSLADAVGMEAYQYVYSIKALMETDRPETCEITDISIEDGRLKIQWVKNNNLRFSHYSLERNWQLEGGIDASGTVIIKDQNQNVFIDSSFIGGNATYKLFIHLHGVQYPYGSQTEFVYYPRPQLDYSYDEDYNVTLTWNSCPLYNNISKYTVYGDIFSDVVYETTEPSDTVYQFEAGISNSFQRGIIWYGDSASLPAAYMHQQQSLAVYAGLMGSYDNSHMLFTNTIPPDLYYAKYSNISKWNTYSHKVETALYDNLWFIDYDVSPNGLHLVQSCLDHPFLRVFDTEDLENYQDYEIQDITGYPTSVKRVAASNTGLLAGLLYDDHVMGYDLNSEELKFIIPVDCEIEKSDIFISPSANYFMVLDYSDLSIKLFDINSSGANLIVNLGNNFMNAFFMNDENDDKLISITTEGEVQIYRCSDQAIINSFHTDADRILNIDPITAYLFTINTEDKKYLFYDVASGTLLKEMPYDLESSAQSILVDSKVYTCRTYFPINF